MIGSSCLESFIHLYHYFLYKWAEGLACTKQTKDTTDSVQERAEDFSSVLKTDFLVNLAVVKEQLLELHIPGYSPQLFPP